MTARNRTLDEKLGCFKDPLRDKKTHCHVERDCVLILGVMTLIEVNSSPPYDLQ
jgi:hypothetical protein